MRSFYAVHVSPTLPTQPNFNKNFSLVCTLFNYSAPIVPKISGPIMHKTTLTEATEAHFFTQESSSTHRFQGHFPSNGIRSPAAEFISPATEFISNSISVEMNSMPVSRTRFLCKKASFRGLRNPMESI